MLTDSSLKRRFAGACLALFGAAVVTAGSARAEDLPAEIRIGVMSDMSGAFSDLAGPGSVVAAQMAVDEFGGKVAGRPVRILSVDHQNKPDVAAAATRKWFEVDGVSMAIDYPISSAAIAAQDIGRQMKKIVMFSTAGTTALTGKSCSPYGFHWMFDTYSNSFGLVKPLMEQGLDSFYFITVDYALGHAAQADFTKALEAANLKIVGSVKTPLNAPDLSSPVLVAKASKAKAIIIAAGGPDMVNSVKAAQSFGLAKTGKRIITPYVFLTDIRAMGLETAQGLIFVDAFYWDLDDRTREFAKRFFERHKAMPTFAQAGVYSATRHYLKAVEAVKSIDADLVSAKMRETPVEDAVVKHGKIRPDGRLVHDMYLVEVKSPAESKSDWDVEKVLRVIPGDQAFKPLSESDCPLIKH